MKAVKGDAFGKYNIGNILCISEESAKGMIKSAGKSSYVLVNWVGNIESERKYHHTRIMSESSDILPYQRRDQLDRCIRYRHKEERREYRGSNVLHDQWYHIFELEAKYQAGYRRRVTVQVCREMERHRTAQYQY